MKLATLSVAAATPRRFAFALLLFLSTPAFAQSYVWKNVAIRGGGFVSGLLTHPHSPGVVYARTDIGGAYRWNGTNGSWIPLLDFAADADTYGIESFAIDPSDGNRLYIAASRGSSTLKAIMVSTNRGDTFTSFTPPFSLDGNARGRGGGERMAVDPNLGSILFYGTRGEGLYRSTNYGATWSQVTTFPVSTTANSVGIVFVQFVEESGTPGSPTPVLFAAVSQTGNNLYRSIDSGSSWAPVSTVDSASFMPHHAAQDGLGNMYITFNDTCGPNDNVSTGAVCKLNLGTLASTDVSPVKLAGEQGGWGGVSVDAQHPAHLVVSTLDRWWPSPYDQVYRSTNGGASWKTTAASLPSTGDAPWNASRTPHWCENVQIDPFDSGRAWYVTGYGVFSCTNLTSADSNGVVYWTFTNDGLEETVPLGLASPPSGPNLFSQVGDQGGFRHYDVDVSPPVTDYFATHRGTSSGIDFAGNNPDVVVRLFSDSPYGGYSLDGGTTWNDFATTPAGTTGPGNIDVSADGSRIVWKPAGATAFYYSADKGDSWVACVGAPGGTRSPIADRVNAFKFYIYTSSSGGRLYVSTDGGATFNAAAAISASSSTLVPRAVFGREGDLWLPRGTGGLARSTNSGTNFTTLATVQQATYVAFGKAATGQTYPAVYIIGQVNGVTGIFRSDNQGASWTRINDDQHQFGLSWVHCFCADPRVYGRVYFGTEGRGIIYGEPAGEPPGPVIELTAVGGDAQIALSWSAASGADTYTVKRALTSGGPYASIAAGLTETIYTDTGLTNGVLYYYVATASNTAGESTHSPETSARPVSLEPTQLALAIGAGQLRLNWPQDHTGWKLQTQTNRTDEGLGTNWTTVTASESTNQFTMPVDAANGSVFFRLVSP